MDHDELDDLTPPGDVLGTQPLERTGPVATERTGRATARLGLSVPGAIGGVLLIGAIAFGANLGLAGTAAKDAAAPTPPTEVAAALGETVADRTPAPRTKDDDRTDGPEPTKGPDAAEPTTAPDPTEKATEKPEPTKEPTAKPDPTKKPTPKPDPTKEPTPKPTAKPVLELALAAKEGGVLVKWSACDVDGADYYKVVRSSDSTVKWPAGDNDEVVAAVEIGGTPKAWDGDAPAGKKAWYRVFCVKRSGDGYRVLAASGAKAIVAPEDAPKPTPKPTPEVSAMWIEAGAEGGAVTLRWEACGSDGFSHYRMLRKVDGEAQVVAEIGDAGTTTYVDDGLEPGTYRYAVQAKGTVDGDWVLLGATEWATVTID